MKDKDYCVKYHFALVERYYEHNEPPCFDNEEDAWDWDYEWLSYVDYPQDPDDDSNEEEEEEEEQDTNSEEEDDENSQDTDENAEEKGGPEGEDDLNTTQ